MSDSRPPDDPLLERLQGLRRDLLDDVAAARTLARGEAAFVAASPAAAPRLRGWLVPAALALWSVFYVGSAARQIFRLFPAAAAEGARAASLVPRAPAPVVLASGGRAGPPMSGGDAGGTSRGRRSW